jgi:hypothetical protein
MSNTDVGDRFHAIGIEMPILYICQLSDHVVDILSVVNTEYTVRHVTLKNGEIPLRALVDASGSELHLISVEEYTDLLDNLITMQRLSR